MPKPARWDGARLADVARRIARLAESPPAPWLSHGWFRSYLGLRAPLVAAGGADAAFLARDADAVLDRLDRLPQVFCHFDLHPGNVLGRAADVVIDWAYCGIGAIGLDAGVLAADALFDAFVPVGSAADVLSAVLAGYADGIAEEGLPLGEARWAFLAGTALRLAWIPGYLALGLGSVETRDRFRALIPFLRDIAAVARELPSAP